MADVTGATTTQISYIIAAVKATMDQPRVGSGATTQYVYNTY